MNAINCRLKPYIQPFERRLAIEELRSLAGANPVPVDGAEGKALVFTVTSEHGSSRLADKLAYWECVETDQRRFTRQVYLEATASAIRAGVAAGEAQTPLDFSDCPVLPNRRCLRYGTHGIHEYRGKFFPQLVRSLLNIADVRKHGVVGDPMCGSGTTNVESILAEHHTLGMDMNPLSVLMARVKCSLLAVDPKVLSSAYEHIRCQLIRSADKREATLSYFQSLPLADQHYLSAWFSKPVLYGLDEVARAIQSSDRRVRYFFRLCLSNIIRSVSWQKDDDLRVRREIRLDAKVEPVREFLEELGRSVRVVLAFLHQNHQADLGSFEIADGDARDMKNCWAQWRGRIDTIVTSPPYATALPYLDTDRLSLCYLGLLARPKHRQRDQRMIGNREISEKQRSAYWDLFEAKENKLPDSVTALIQRVSTLNSRIQVGFRRRNLPALLTKYFIDMRQVFEGIVTVLRPGSPAYVVIGNNHTIAGGERVEIDTASLLVDVGASVGMTLKQRIPMEMLVSRDIFKRNAVASEEILWFRTSP